MTDEEKAERKWNEISSKYTRIEDMACRIIKDDFIKVYLDGLAEGRKEGYEQGMKKICEICEQHMLKEHPNACGCAFRRLGNEYCWEFK